MCLHNELGDDAETSSSSPDGEEQVCILTLIGTDNAAIYRDDLSLDDVV